MPVGLSSSTRPPKLCTFSTRTSELQLVCEAEGIGEATAARSRVMRRRSHRTRAGPVAAAAGLPAPAAVSGTAARIGLSGGGGVMPRRRLYCSIQYRSRLREISSEAAARDTFHFDVTRA